MSIADTIAVMKDGELQQLGTASDIYESPANRFVADFIGRANFLPGRISGRNGARAFAELSAGITVELKATGAADHPGEEGEVLVRPEAVSIADIGHDSALRASIEQISDQGSVANVHGRLPGGSTIIASVARCHSGFNRRVCDRFDGQAERAALVCQTMKRL